MLLIHDNSAAVHMKRNTAEIETALYITAFINAALSFVKIILCISYRSYFPALESILHTATAAVCIACALTPRKGHAHIKDEITNIVSGFPQVSRIHDIRFRKYRGTVCAEILISLNTYSVHGSGARTCQIIENAVKRHIGNGFTASVSVKKYHKSAAITDKRLKR